uniref:Uncharacterized protein n=1 Tax=Glossina palpalis gambiensis TaxID=67801 RepID=A0A1B0B740_9MUSC
MPLEKLYLTRKIVGAYKLTTAALNSSSSGSILHLPRFEIEAAAVFHSRHECSKQTRPITIKKRRQYIFNVRYGNSDAAFAATAANVGDVLTEVKLYAVGGGSGIDDGTDDGSGDDVSDGENDEAQV